jgi:hypothetical protein
VTGQVTFGDFLRTAHQALAARPGGPSPARGDVEEVSRSLQRVLTIMGRYLQDTAVASSDVPRHMHAPGGPWGEARAQARQALANAAGFLLRPGTGRPMWPPPPSVSSLARRLDEAATALTTGRDLLHTHFTPGPQGGRAHRSPWALAITSEPLNRALLAEIAALARPIARYGANVALAFVPGAPSRSEHRRALGAACDWLLVLAGSIDQASRRQPVSAADRELLAAIPVYAMPARPSLATAESVSGLYDGVTATAERLRHLAWQTAGQPPWSPRLTATSLRQAAEASTVTSHHCALLAKTLAASAHGIGPVAKSDLWATATAAHQARGAWYQAARALRHITTDTHGHLSPAAAEARDLACWTGRLAYTDPAWTLASGPDHPARTPQDLAPLPDDLPQAVAAVHHAADALAALADTEYDHLRGAIQARRILVPTRTLPDDYDIPRPYAPAPDQHTRTLLSHYRDACHASRDTAAMIGRAAQVTRAPSQALTTARAASQSASPAHDTTAQTTPHGQEHAPDMPGPLQHTLLRLGITSPALLDRGADLDRASQRLLTDAADQLPPGHQRLRASTLHKSAASAALLNYALATTTDGRAPRLIRQPSPSESKDHEPELEPEP